VYLSSTGICASMLLLRLFSVENRESEGLKGTRRRGSCWDVFEDATSGTSESCSCGRREAGSEESAVEESGKRGIEESRKRGIEESRSRSTEKRWIGENGESGKKVSEEQMDRRSRNRGIGKFGKSGFEDPRLGRSRIRKDRGIEESRNRGIEESGNRGIEESWNGGIGNGEELDRGKSRSRGTEKRYLVEAGNRDSGDR
jgi:hypothetical protein